ncbi:MAG: hypothetical protein KGI91_06495 [Burkholderiales bacterium]|nr:hypothetical protein [Burkholderiales bacterium]
MKNRTNVFFDDQDLERLKGIASQNEQSLAWLLRKIVGGFLKNLDNKQLPTATAQEVNAAVADQDLAKMMEEFQRQAPREEMPWDKI